MDAASPLSSVGLGRGCGVRRCRTAARGEGLATKRAGIERVSEPSRALGNAEIPPCSRSRCTAIRRRSVSWCGAGNPGCAICSGVFAEIRRWPTILRNRRCCSPGHAGEPQDRERFHGVELKHWLESDPDAPEGKWFKRFKTGALAGNGEKPSTFLSPGMAVEGHEVQ